MSKASTATAKTPTQLPSQSAWARGPPQSNSSSTPSPRSQSPAPSHTAIPISHSRHPSALGQGVSVKDGVTVPRNNVGSVRPGSIVFGSIDDTSAPLSSSLASTPAIKTEVIKFFGTVPAASSNHVNDKTTAYASITVSSKQPARPSISSPFKSSTANAAMSTASTPKPTINKADIAKFFWNPSSSSSQLSSDTSSPSTRPHNLPPHHQPSSSTSQPLPQPSQLGAHPYAQFVPGMRQTQQSASVPRSPAFTRAVANIPTHSRLRGPGGPGGPPIPASPRMAPHPHQTPPTGVAPQVPMQPTQWGGYYYPMDPYNQPQHSWYYPMASSHMHQQPHQHGPDTTPPHSVPPLSMSPRPTAPQLPGTPTMTHIIPHPPHTHQLPPSVSSPPPTPSTSDAPRLNTNASAFVPDGHPSAKITIESQNGMEMTLDALKKHSPQPPTVPIPPASPIVTSRRTTSIRIESEEIKRLREEALRNEQKKQEAKREKKDKEEWIRKKEEDEENGRLRREEEEHIEVQHKAAKRDATPPSALPTVRVIENLSEVYSEGIESPKVELNNANITNGRFRYDREFLMQFMRICIEKPPTFHLLNVLGFEPVYQSSFAMDRGSSAAGLGIGSFQKPSVLGPFQTSNLLSTGSRLTIQELLPPSPGGKGSKRTRAKRGNSNKALLSQQGQGSASRPTSRKPSIDLGQADVPEPPGQHKKLQLLPRSKPTAEESTPVPSGDKPESAPTDMSEADAKKKVDEDVKEFFAVRNLEEADVYFINLPREHRFRLVEKLVASALEGREADARLVGEFFALAASNGRCTLEVFEEGFMPMAEVLDDIVIDAPKAFDHMAIMLKGAGFGKEPERLKRITLKLEDSNKLFLPIAAAENKLFNRQASMSRGGSRRGGESNQEYSPDGWAVTGGSVSRSPPNPEGGDLSQFGKISKGAPMVMGPNSVFASGKEDSKRESLSRTNSNSNMFHILGQNPVDQRSEALALRKKLQLLPRFKPSGTNRQKAED